MNKWYGMLEDHEYFRNKDIEEGEGRDGGKTEYNSGGSGSPYQKWYLSHD